MAVNLISGNDTTINQTDDDIQVNFSTTRSQQINEIESNITNISGTVLWENSDTTSDFGEQSINLSSGDYDILEVFYYDYKNTTSMKSVRALKGENIRLDAIFFYSNIMYFSTRTLSYTNNTQLNADAGKQAGSNAVGTISAAPAQCIPVKIIGYKSSN